MEDIESFFDDLSNSEIEGIRSLACELEYAQGEHVFMEGDEVDYFYIVDHGRLCIYFNKNGEREEVYIVGPGEYFGEMAIFNQDKRLASVQALEPVKLLAIDKEIFLGIIRLYPVLAEKINRILVKRNEEFTLRESLMQAAGIECHHLHVSIKGDPSIRETAFNRERYESIVDPLLPQLIPQLQELMLNRSVFKLFVAFNSGEIRTTSVFDPFVEEIHTAGKLADNAYVERHFPRMSFEDKSRIVKKMYQFIRADAAIESLPGHWKNIIQRSHTEWQPVPFNDIFRVLSSLCDLRNIQNFYLRNFSISMVQNAIRMQFNCDGTHIVSMEDYQQFLEENLMLPGG